MRFALLIAVAQPLFVAGKLRIVRSHSASPYGDDAGDGYEYGDMEASAGETDDTDYSVHQFLAKDEARDPMGSDDNEEDAAQNDADRSKILSKETFDSEDEPAADSFLQKSSKRKGLDDEDEFEYGDEESAAGETDNTDYSVHQFLAKDEARDPMGSDDAEEDAERNNAERSKILGRETFDAEDTPADDSFLQKRSTKSRQNLDDDGDDYEYGDEENAAGETDNTDYSVHQFLVNDEARDPMGSDDNEEDAAQNDAARSKIMSKETFDSEDEPADDNFLQRSSKRNKKQPVQDGMEYGDEEAAAGQTDGTDYSVHQFLAKDEARDPMGSDDSEEDAAQNDADRSKILSKETFDSEDEPADDNFLQRRSKRNKKQPSEGDMEYGDEESAAGETDNTDYSVHQFLVKDEARDPMGSDDAEEDAAQNDADRSKILSKETFDSEDEPADDNFLQRRSKRNKKQPAQDDMEYGDEEAAAGQTDGTDYSVHQFLAKDEARDPMGSDDSEEDAAQNDADRSKILSKETFDSEDEPADDN